MATGDLRFYRAGDSIADRIVSTTGPFVHVDIETADGTVIGELSDGLHRYAAPPDGPRIVIYPIAEHASETGILRALDWALSQLDSGPGRSVPGYGWADIVDAAIYHLDTDFPVAVETPGRWDCSDFATRYLLMAGMLLPGWANAPATVTPSQLAAALGIS